VDPRESEFSRSRKEADVITIAILVATIPPIGIVIVIAMLRAGITREEADKSLRGAPATRASAMTRRMVGLYVRMPHQADATADGADRTAGQEHSGRRWPGDSGL
jgi:hypothetical protein